MKRTQKLVLTLAAIFLCVSHIQAQEQTTYEAGQMAINGGLAYGFDLEEAGIRAGATYFLNEQMRVGGDINYWLVGDDKMFGGSVSLTYMEINGNFNYIFHSQDQVMFYGIGSLGIHYAKSSWNWAGIGGGSGDNTDTKLGLGVGAGAEYNLGSISIFAEPKLFLSGFDQLKLNFGVRYYL
jgi:opacity protein-like surface antigen